jgi:hypothetical protein
MSSHKRRGPTFDSKENRPRLCEPKCNKRPRRSFIRIQTRAIRTLIKQYSGASNGLMKLILSPATPIVYTNISLRHPWLAQENRLKSLTDFCRFTSFVMEGHPFAPIRTQAFATVGDVLFTDDNSTFIIDGNEIPLSTSNAAVFRLLLRNAGQVVARSALTHARTTRDKELYLNTQIGEIRKALGSEYRRRVVTVRNEGYVYQRFPTTLAT